MPARSPCSASPSPRATPRVRVRAVYLRSTESPSAMPTLRVTAALDNPSAKHRERK